jgi:type IV pilus assembly protein PilN
MIRINLLAVERKRAKKARVLIPAAHRVTIGATLILLATVLGVGWWFWALRERSSQLDRDIASAEAETQQLRSVLGQVQKFEARKAQLQQRVTLIEELRQGQGAPVRLLDELSRALPEMLWLSELKQAPTGELTISGRCVTLTALSDFVSNLERSGFFKRPVEIVDSQVESASAPVGEVIKFSIKAQFEIPGAPQPAAAAVQAARR